MLLFAMHNAYRCARTRVSSPFYLIFTRFCNFAWNSLPGLSRDSPGKSFVTWWRRILRTSRSRVRLPELPESSTPLKIPYSRIPILIYGFFFPLESRLLISLRLAASFANAGDCPGFLFVPQWGVDNPYSFNDPFRRVNVRHVAERSDKKVG